jgi:hypothetical protein
VDWIELAYDSPVVGCFEHGNEPSVSVKREELLDYMNRNQLLKKDFFQFVSVRRCLSSGMLHRAVS